jgi:Tol biopolymer transport system component
MCLSLISSPATVEKDAVRAMHKIHRLIAELLMLLALAMLTGCGDLEPSRSGVATRMPSPLLFESAPPTPPSPPTEIAPPTPTPRPSEIATLAPTPSSTATPSPALTPQPYPTPEWTPYADTPFTVAFLRHGGQLWLSEVGGRGEWALTNGGTEWGVYEFAISPDGQTIAFLTRSEGKNTCVRLVNVQDGTARVLAGRDDPYQEFNVTWWDATHVAFQIGGKPVEEYEGDTSVWGEIQPYTLVVVDVETGERTIESASSILHPSPDRRYAVSGHVGSVRPDLLPYQLYDRETNERWQITEEGEFTKFLAWSPDSRLMLFGKTRDDVVVGSLFVVDVETRTRWVITPQDKVGHSGAWSPDSQTIAYSQCDPPSTACTNPELWLTSPDGTDRRPIPMEEYMNRGGDLTDNTIVFVYRIAWTFDGSRLVFKADNTIPGPENIWSVRVDGTDLRPIAYTNKGAAWALPLP